MDEAVKIYNPRESYLVAERSKEKKEVVHKKFSTEKEPWYETLQKVFNEREEEIRALVFRHGWVNLFYNWVLAILVIAMIFGMIGWAVRISNDRKVESMFATAMAEFDAEQQAKADAEAAAVKAEQESEAYIERKLAEPLARLYQGANAFKDKYGYTERDFKTLGRCAFNRVESGRYPNDLIEVINQENQWVGYTADVPIMDDYLQMALRHVHEWRTETTKPCANDYLWAEYTPNGIFLKNDYNADGYSVRWRATV